MFDESRIAQSAAGPEIDRLRQREAELLALPTNLTRDHEAKDWKSKI